MTGPRTRALYTFCTRPWHLCQGLVCFIQQPVRLLSVVLLLLLDGCAARTTTPLQNGEIASEAARRWTVFTETDTDDTSPFFSSSLSLHIRTHNKSHRLKATMWGAVSHPLRLDIQAGIGMTVGMIREDRTGFFVVLPEDNLAYAGSSTSSALAELGMDIPFSLQDLARMLRGEIHETIGAIAENYTKVTLENNSNLAYDLSRPANDSPKGQSGAFTPASTLVLDQWSRPVQWTLPGAGLELGWQLDFAGYEDQPDSTSPLSSVFYRPGRIIFTRLDENGMAEKQYTVRIIVKDVQVRSEGYSEEETTLALPPGMTVEYIEPAS